MPVPVIRRAGVPLILRPVRFIVKNCMFKGVRESFHRWRYERRIRGLLRKLARQRVFLTGPRGAALWIVEGNPEAGDLEFKSMIRTCHLRGWVEPAFDKPIPRAPMPNNVDDIFRNPFVPTESDSIYRLTEAGWHVINRTHTWLLWTFAVSALSLLAAILGILMTL